MSKQSFEKELYTLFELDSKGNKMHPYFVQNRVDKAMQLIREHLLEVKESLGYEDATEDYYYALDMLAERLGL